MSLDTSVGEAGSATSRSMRDITDLHWEINQALKSVKPTLPCLVHLRICVSQEYSEESAQTKRGDSVFILPLYIKPEHTLQQIGTTIYQRVMLRRIVGNDQQRIIPVSKELSFCANQIGLDLRLLKPIKQVTFSTPDMFKQSSCNKDIATIYPGQTQENTATLDSLHWRPGSSLLASVL